MKPAPGRTVWHGALGNGTLRPGIQDPGSRIQIKQGRFGKKNGRFGKKMMDISAKIVLQNFVLLVGGINRIMSTLTL